MDSRDRKILALLGKNSRLSCKEIGEQVHLTGQAVALRVQQLVDKQIIKRFTIDQHHENIQFITIYMNNGLYQQFESMVLKYTQVLEFNKITGEGCYLIKCHFDSEQLDNFLQLVTQFGRYKINSVVKNLR